MLSVVAWDGEGDGTNWSDPVNWSSDALPDSDDEVRIEIGGIDAIQHAAGIHSIQSLFSTRPLTLTGGTLEVGTTIQVDNAFRLQGGTLADATILPGNGGQGLIFTSSGGTLDSVTADSDLDLATENSAHAYVENGLTLNSTAWLGSAAGSTSGGLYFRGTQSLSGTGEVVLGKHSSNYLKTYATTSAET
ncbi:MAG: hypothetical protein R6U98_29960, partial [Pirellulaceae bacterium]